MKSNALAISHRLILAVTAALLVSHAPATAAEPLPGEGKTIRFAQNDSLGANYVQNQVIISALNELGYKTDLMSLGLAAILQSAAQGDLDITADITFPRNEPAYKQVEKQLAVVGGGAIIGGGINGYIIDKKTAEAYNITNIEQLKDPKLAALFDSDGDGKADLVNCDPGWACGELVDFQLKKYGLTDTVRSVRAKYEALMGEAFARAKRGEPYLVFTWSPSWMTDVLVPGKDVVWLPTPFDAAPEGMSVSDSSLVPGVVGCAGNQDPCRMSASAWNWRIVANREFLAANPAVQKLGEIVKWPVSTWAAWEAALNKGKGDRHINKLAEAWISENQDLFKAWVSEAAAAAK